MALNVQIAATSRAALINASVPLVHTDAQALQLKDNQS